MFVTYPAMIILLWIGKSTRQAELADL